MSAAVAASASTTSIHRGTPARPGRRRDCWRDNGRPCVDGGRRLPQLGGERRRRVEPAIRFGGDHLLHDGGHLAGQAALRRLTARGTPSGQHLDQDQAKRVDIDAMVDRRAGHLLGRPVRGRGDGSAALSARAATAVRYPPRPKSIVFALPLAVTMMVSGVIARCTRSEA